MINKRIKIKHKLQWKLIIIMFVSILNGIILLGLSQAVLLGMLADMTAEEAQRTYPLLFDSFFLAVTIVTFFALSRKMVKRIEKMNQNVSQIAEGKMKELEVDCSRDELGNLSRNIGKMAEKIDKSLEKEREMVCSIAHDLRTPVTSIEGYATLLSKSESLSEEEKQHLYIIQSKSRDLSKQIGELLEYSVLQFEEQEYEKEIISVSKLLEQVLIEFIPQFEREGFSFSFTGEKNVCMINCNQMLMVRMFENLITNSIRYGRHGRKIEVEVFEEESSCRFFISNYNSDLKSEELKHLFEPFFKGENADEYRTESKGLGLAIVKKIVAIHNGKIYTECDNESGRISFITEFFKN